MPISRNDLIAYLDETLAPEKFSDYCPNGLQVAGKHKIHQIVTGVTANKALFEQAIDINADLILVHHGLFWQGDDFVITGIHHQRLKMLLANDINLVGYHLPLDFHEQFGNNVQLAKQLKINLVGEFSFSDNPLEKGLIGKLPQSMTMIELTNYLEHKLGHRPLSIPANDRLIETIAWVTGAAGKFIHQLSAQHSVDAYLTGEISESIVHAARELDVHCIVAGHHATERYGVKALGEFLAEKFDLTHHFIDVFSPV